jgi:hypothetical protein
MAAKLSNLDAVREALKMSGGRPIEVEDETTQMVYVIVSLAQFRDMQHRVMTDGTLSAAEMLAAAAAGNSGEEGWDAEGMDVYDDSRYDVPKEK